MTRSRLFAAIAASSLLIIGSAACAPPENKDEGGQTESGVNAKEATSAADFGGMDGLVISPGKPEESMLIRKIKGTAGARMPLRSPVP